MDPLAHARDIAALDRPATEWEYSRATLAVLLAIHDRLAAQAPPQQQPAQAKPQHGRGR